MRTISSQTSRRVGQVVILMTEDEAERLLRALDYNQWDPFAIEVCNFLQEEVFLK